MALLVTSARRVLSHTPVMLGLPLGRRGAGRFAAARAGAAAPRPCEVTGTEASAKIRPKALAMARPFICHLPKIPRTLGDRPATRRDWRSRVASRRAL